MQDASIVNLRDLEFQLFEVFEAEALTARARHADHSRETFTAALDTAHAVATEKFATHNRLSDEHEPHFDGERVTVLRELKDALDAMRASGFLATGKDYEWGGMQLPSVIAFACLSLFKSANIGYSFVRDAHYHERERDRTFWQRRAEAQVSSGAIRRPRIRHDGAHRTAGGFEPVRSLPPQPRRTKTARIRFAAARSSFGWRPRAEREHRASRARAHSGRTGGCERHLALYGAEI